jgi:hypothetical protein
VAGGVAQGVGPESKPQYHKKNWVKKQNMGYLFYYNLIGRGPSFYKSIKPGWRNGSSCGVLAYQAQGPEFKPQY